jgi:hypothetical protein
MNRSLPAAIAKIAPDGKLTPRQVRRLLIDMARRRVRPGTGSSHGFMQRRTAMHPWPDLRDILAGLDWVIAGGVATRAYMPERMTKDLDILVKVADAGKARRMLQAAGYLEESELAIPGYQLRSPEGVAVDLLLSDAPWLDEALSRPGQDPAGYPVLGLPYLVLLKLTSSRSQDVADVSRMLGWASDETLNEVRAVVARYSPQDSEDLESLIFIGQQERQQP